MNVTIFVSNIFYHIQYSYLRFVPYVHIYIYTYIYTLTYVYIHGYIIQMVNFMGKEMINNCVLGYTIFRQNHMAKALKLFLNLFMYPATQG
jgi:hypothetical protein